MNPIRVLTLCLLMGTGSIGIVTAQNPPVTPLPMTTPQEQELHRLNQEGGDAFNKKAYVQAEQVWTSGLEKATTADSKRWIGMFRYNLGVLYGTQKQWEKAAAQYQEAISVFAELNSEADVLKISLILGNIGETQRNWRRVQVNYERAAALHEKRGERAEAIDGYVKAALALQDQKKYSEALSRLKKVLLLAETAQDVLRRGVIYNWMGFVYGNLKNYAETLTWHEKARTLFEQVGNKAWIAANRRNIGLIYAATRRYDEALDFFQQAFTIRQEISKTDPMFRDVTVLTLFDIVEMWDNADQPDRMLEAVKRALTISQEYGLTDKIAQSYERLADVYDRRSEFDNALNACEEARRLHEVNNNRRSVALCLANRSVILAHMGQFDKAIDAQNRALEIRRDLGNRNEIGDSLISIGTLYSYLGQFEAARTYFKDAFGYFALLDQFNAGRAFMLEGLMSANLGRYDEAYQRFEIGMKLSRSFNYPEGVALANDGLGLMRWYQGRYAESFAHFQEALKYYESAGEDLYTAYTYAGLGMASAGLKRWEEGLRYVDKTDAYLKVHPNDRDLAIAAGIRGLLYEGMERWQDAAAAYTTMLNRYEALEEQVNDGDALRLLLEALPNPHVRTAAMLLKSGKTDDALRIVERGRGRGLVKQATLTRTDLAQSLKRLLKPEDAAEMQKRESAYLQASRYLHGLQNQALPTDGTTRTLLTKQIGDAQAKYNEADQQLTQYRDKILLRPEYETYRRLRAGDPPSAERIKALAAKNPDTLYLIYATLNETTTLQFALSAAAGLKTFSITVPAGEMVQRAERWRYALVIQKGEDADSRTERIKTERKEATALYHLLFDSLEKEGYLKSGAYKRMVIVADGVLLDVPFAALRDDQGERLVARYALSTSVSLGALISPPQPRKATNTLLCIADPLLKTQTAAVAPAQPQAVASAQADETRGPLGPLPNARIEAEKVGGLFPGTKPLEGEQATETEVKRIIGQYDLLHFATHGITNDKVGMRSSLVLTDTAEDDGYFEAREIVNIPLAARMAVLSACETGRGQKTQGEGLMGLAWAFQAAGCPSIVASQWKVSDRRTALLMQYFYTELKKPGTRKDEALQKAMQQLRKLPDAEEPYWWAAFKIIGDTTPLQN